MPKFLTLVLFTVLLLPETLWAQETTKLTLPARADVRIIVDISGSMKQTDPSNLRQPAVRLLARVLPEGSTAGVWTFGQYVNMLVPHGEVAESWRETAIERSKKINSVALRTNLGKAIEVASDDYVTGGSLENTHFILLTDGKVDISDSAEVNQAEEQRILNQVLEDLAARGATFHPVALSNLADANFLKTLAEESQGSYRMADTAESLNLAFLDALNNAAPQEQIPFEGNAFTVDDGVKEFTALIFRAQPKAGEAAEPADLELIRPDGKALLQSARPDNVRWAREAAYDLVTITEPKAGEWRVKGELGEGSRVTVVSDLRMVVSPLPATFTAESPVDVRVAFFEKSKKMTNPEFLDVISVELSLTSEDGRKGSKRLSADQPPADGEYTDTISKLPAEGLYRIDVVADGKTFARKFSATTEFIVPVGMKESSMGAPIDISMAEQVPASSEPSEPESVVKSEVLPAEPIDVAPIEKESPASEKPSASEDPPKNEELSAKNEPENASALPVPLWVIGAAVGGLVILALIIIVLMRRRRNAEDAPDAPDTPDDNLEELQQDMADVEAETPVLMPEPEEEPAEEDIPIASTVVEPEEPDETIPELTEPAEDSEDGEDGENGEEEEFGLDDFDLSEFDDLPDFDSSDEPEKGGNSDDEQKK
ncbi:MAG: VWA domain-containing protein [Marinobacter sp.]|nr:VWA domain-containing protein [Marinobacter sp.]